MHAGTSQRTTEASCFTRSTCWCAASPRPQSFGVCWACGPARTAMNSRPMCARAAAPESPVTAAAALPRVPGGIMAGPRVTAAAGLRE